MDLVDVGGHAARTEIADAGGIQFRGSSSSNRWAGWAAMRERTSLSQACGSTPFILAVTIRLYIERRAVRRDRIRKTATTFFPGRSPAALARRHCWTSIHSTQPNPTRRPTPEEDTTPPYGDLASRASVLQAGEPPRQGLVGQTLIASYQQSSAIAPQLKLTARQFIEAVWYSRGPKSH